MSPKTSGEAPKKVSEVQQNISKSDKKKKRKRKSYSNCIRRVLERIHPDTSISNEALSIMNSFMNDVFDRIAAESTHFAQCSKRRKRLTITIREIETAVRRLLPGDLGKRAVIEGTRAIKRFNQSN